MWAAAVLQTTLVLWLAQQTLQAGIKPIDWGNKNVGVPLKPEPVGHVFKPRVTWPDRVKPERPIYPPIDPHIINHRGNGKVNGGIITPRPGGCLHCNGFQRRGCLHCNGFQRRYKTSPSIGVFPPNKWMTKDRFYGASTADLGRLEMDQLGRSNTVGATAPESQLETGFKPTVPPLGGGVKSIDPVIKSSNLKPLTPIDEQSKALAGRGYEPVVSERWGITNLEATLAARGATQQLPLDDFIRSMGKDSSHGQKSIDYDSSSQQNQHTRNCGSNRDLSDVLEINRHKLLGSETRSHTQEEGHYRLPPSKNQDARRSIFSPPQSLASESYFPAGADKQGVRDLGLDTNGPGKLQGGVRYGPVIPGAEGSLGIASVEGKQGKGFPANGQEPKHLPHAEHDVPKSKPLSIPGQAGWNVHSPRVGATGFMGAGGANGYGYGNGYSNGYGNGYSNGHGYSAELADGAGRKSGKRAGLSTGGYAGLGQGAYGPTQVHYDNYHTGLDEDYLGKINGGNGGIRNGYTG